jgi:glycosyltransferase involved in cell wall biosynthesis
MDVSQLRIALFTGNYNYVRDGANQALNRLVGYCLQQGASVRIYAPTVETPAFPPTGDLIGVPSFAIPTRSEYRAPLMIPASIKADIKAFRPNIFHIASPEILGHRAVTLARKWDVPVVASVHTRFETYFRYYRLGFVEPLIEAALRRLYRRCDAIFAPSESMVDVLRGQRMNDDVGIWTRGVDRDIFTPARRSLDWRQSHGIADDEPVIGFVGRLVMEKGLDVFSDAIDQLQARGIRHKVLIIGDGPAGDWFRQRLPNGVFAGYQQGEALGRAVASMDMLFNPSITETFGNVTLEAMASALPVVAATATGSQSLVRHGVTGALVPPGDIGGFADALQLYCTDPQARGAAGHAGLEESQRFGWDEVNQALVDSYLRVISRRQG